MSTDRINGGVKFFEKNYALFREGSKAEASVNEDNINSILDISKYTEWRSVGSNDSTLVTLTVTLKFSQSIDSIMLVGTNFKKFNIKYQSGNSFLDFTNVVGVNGVTRTGINETDYSYSTAFYQFDAVTAQTFRIECDQTQIANAEKFLSQFVATKELGTFKGFPRVQPEAMRNETKAKALSRRYVIQKTYETNKIKIVFKNHPFQNDLDIIENIFDREEPFLVLPCGGRTGDKYFKLDQKAWGLDDLFNMQISGKLKNEFEKGVYTLGFKKSITLEEHI